MSELEHNETPQSISVDIYDQIYNLRGTDPVQIEKLAAHVDSRMRAVSAQGATVDSLRVAVLAALNIADELFSMRERYSKLAGSMDQVSQSQTTLRSRTDSLSSLLDSVLEERKAG